MPECTAIFLSALPAITAVSTAICAVVSVWLAVRIHRESKSDERIIFGPLEHPYATVANPAHYNAVIGCAVFNKAHRTAYIKNVVAFDGWGEKVNVAWTEPIDHLGNLGEPRALIGILSSNNLYIRRSDGEPIDCLRLEIAHSFRDSPETLTFNPIADSE